MMYTTLKIIVQFNLMKAAIVSGTTGQDGSYLVELLLEKEYDVKRNEHLFLFTVRHYTQNILDEELRNRSILLEQKTRQTIQMVVQ